MLRRAERSPPGTEEIAAVRADLESELGPTVSRALAARALGVSQTALHRWIRSGDVPTVLTPRGRVEVPRRFVVELAEELDEVKAGSHRRPLATALKRRREQAERFGSRLPASPGGSRRRSGHGAAEERSLAYHRAVAKRLDRALVAEARRRIERWSAEGKIHPRWATRWQELLSQPLEQIRAAIQADSQAGRDLRQNSPFAGALSELERQQILDRIR